MGFEPITIGTTNQYSTIKLCPYNLKKKTIRLIYTFDYIRKKKELNEKIK